MKTSEVARVINEWYSRLDATQKRARERCKSGYAVRHIAALAAANGVACTDRIYVSNSYRYQAQATEVAAYRDDETQTVAVASYRRVCGHRTYDSGARPSVSPAEAKSLTEGAPRLPVAIAARLCDSGTGLPGESYALWTGARHTSAQPYDAKGRRLTPAWMIATAEGKTSWYHAATRREALAGLEA